jgi:hypothetical protein
MASPSLGKFNRDGSLGLEMAANAPLTSQAAPKVRLMDNLGSRAQTANIPLRVITRHNMPL